jgi:hypothetical protein
MKETERSESKRIPEEPTLRRDDNIKIDPKGLKRACKLNKADENCPSNRCSPRSSLLRKGMFIVLYHKT